MGSQRRSHKGLKKNKKSAALKNVHMRTQNEKYKDNVSSVLQVNLDAMQIVADVEEKEKIDYLNSSTCCHPKNMMMTNDDGPFAPTPSTSEAVNFDDAW
ncbi:hypothetical protein QE152_g36549 [Popillia japonica]|uniref:Uncharacterized protein n=1 Tax=Popillia japonica TaxID=7064 RepID=A0AAW1IDC5_POPJA